MPSPKGEVDLILSNTTDASLSVSTSIRGEQPKRVGSKTIEVGPHETKVLHLERDLLEKQLGAMSSFGAISIEHNGGPGAVLARGMALEAALGYSLPIQFSDPAKAKSNKLQGAGLRIGKSGSESLSPLVVAHNAGATDVILSGYIPYAAEDGTRGTITLPQVELTAGETEVIDVTPHLRTRGIGDTVAAGLEFEHTGELGSVITSAFSVSRNRNQVFRVPLWDIAAQRSATGGYPWYIEGDSSTMVYIKNVTAEPRQYRMYLKLSNGDYVFPLTTVEPNQTKVIDVRKLRDTQVPDVNGQTIPLTETRGQVQWSMTGGVDRVLIGRSEQVDLIRGTSSNYACQNCCGNSFYDGWVTPAEDTGFEGEQIQYIAMQSDANCYGQIYPAYPANIANYTSTDTSICNPNWMTGETAAVGPGEATITATWTGDAWFMNIGEYCDYTPVQAVRDAICQACSRPTDETTAFAGWATSDGHPTVGRWTQTLLPSTGTFSGRTVTERDPGGGGPDNCWFTNSQVDQFTAITSGTWTVTSSNTWGYDYVGFNAASVQYYRAQGRAPCSVTVPQRMEISCAGAVSLTYKLNWLGYVIGYDTVSSIREGSVQTRTWP